MIKLSGGEWRGDVTMVLGPRWSELHLLDTAQCGYSRHLDLTYLRSIARLSFAVTSGQQTQHTGYICKRLRVALILLTILSRDSSNFFSSVSLHHCVLFSNSAARAASVLSKISLVDFATAVTRLIRYDTIRDVPLTCAQKLT